MIARFFLILLALFLIPCFTFASGKMVVGENQTIMLQAKSGFTSPEYKWALLQNGNIIDTQVGAYYSRLFPQSGSFTLNLTASSPTAKEIENSQVEILVGAGTQFTNSLNITLETFPKLSTSNTVSMPENDLHTGFILQASQGDIKEYRIDADIKIDSDGDGNPSNDIDNQNDTSFYSGALWLAPYQKSQLPTQANATLIDKHGDRVDQLVTVQMASNISTGGKLRAVLETSPTALEDKQIHLQGDAATVYVFMGASEGKILEYRLDNNIAVDSDGDGNPANDIDNLSHPSFHSGGVFALPMTRANGNAVLQLIVVGANGKGSLVQKKILWDSDANLIAQQNFRVYADKIAPSAGETVHFGLDGLLPSEQYNIKWDFNGDKVTDLEKSDGTASFVYDQAGTYNLLVQIKNERLKLLKYATLSLQVQARSQDAPSTRAPISNFTYAQESNKISFTNTSSTDETLVNKEKKFAWDFGDGAKSATESPVHIYKKIGNYIVRLKITDSAGQSHERQILVEIKVIDPKNQEITPVKAVPTEKIDTPVVKKPVIKELTSSSTPQTSTNKSSLATIGLYFLLIISVLVGGVALYLFIQKIKNPDYSFGEIIEEEKEKMLSILEGRPYEAPSGEILNTGKGVNEDIKGILKESDHAEKIKKDMQEVKPAAVAQSTVTESVVTEAVVTEPVKTNPFEKAVAQAAPQGSGETPPSWMQEMETTPPAPAATVNEALPSEPVSVTASLPPSNEPVPNAELNNTPTPTTESSSSNNTPVLDDEIPDWMKETNDTNLEESVVQPAPEPVVQTPEPEPLKPQPEPQPEPVPVVPPVPAAVPSTPPSSDVNDDDIPDWLK